MIVTVFNCKSSSKGVKNLCEQLDKLVTTSQLLELVKQMTKYKQCTSYWVIKYLIT